MEERIQKIISSAGYASRRKAEQLISNGLVKVNGEIANIGDKANPETDEILIDGVLLNNSVKKIYIMVNKPRGYICSLSDEKDRHIVTELVDLPYRLYPVGRLDYNSEGLLLLTNDGDFAYKIMHPSIDIEKTYIVRVRGENIHKQIEEMRKPIVINGKATKSAHVELNERIKDEAILTVKLTEGRNRQIRRLCEKAGLAVLSLTRIQEGPFSLGDLKPGKWRYISNEELSKI